MKYRFFLFIMSLMVNGCVYAITFAERYKNDDLFHTGTGPQLTVYHNEMKKAIAQYKKEKDKRELVAHLYGLICECEIARGHYKQALEYAEQSKKVYEQLLAAPGGNRNLKIPYDYGLICYHIACMNTLLMATAQTTSDSHFQFCKILADWVQRVVATNDKNLIGQQKVNIDYCQYLVDSGSLLLEMTGHHYYDAVRTGKELLDHIIKQYPGNGTQRFEYIDALLLISNNYLLAQDYEQALFYSQEAKALIEKTLGKSNPTYARALYMLAAIYFQLNDKNNFDKYIFPSIDIYQKTGHTTHADYADALELLGRKLQSFPIVDAAREYYNKAYEVIKSSRGVNCFHACVNRYYETSLLMYEGKYSEVYPQMEKILENKMFISNITSNHVVSVMTLYFESSLQCGRYQDVIDKAKDSEDILKIIDATGQSEANYLYMAIGRAYQEAQRNAEACVAFQTALGYFRDMARRNFAFLSEEQRRNFWDRDILSFWKILQLNKIESDDFKGSISKVLYNAALLQKGLLLNASVNMARVIEEKGPESLKRDMRKLQLMMQSNLRKPEDQQACRQLEQRVQNEARKYGDFMDFANYTWQDVLKVMKPGDVAIEFVQSDDNEKISVSAELLSTISKVPKHILLFSYRRDEEPSSKQLIIKFMQSIREKIVPLLKSGNNVYFSPIGELYQFPIEYMELANKKRMDEVYHMHRVSSTRELITMNRQRSNNKKMVLFGGLNYNTSIDDMELQAMVAKEQSRSKKSNNSSSMWTYLPGSMKEVNEIAPIMKSARYQVSTYTQEEGVEEQFKALSGSHTGIIHVATHGFYESNNSMDSEYAGLIFAGANNFWSYASLEQKDIDDGILTAKEISNLNLIGTDLVVLSACQTGLGRVSGEGIFGLQRAFKKAGVQSILMSLWEVDDEATQLLMTAFYRYLKTGVNKHEALKMAQKQVRQRQFVRNGQTVSGNDSYYWGGFILID